MNQNRKAFYETVTREYIASGEKFLCDGSPTFKSEWESKNPQKIYDEARMFLKANPKYRTDVGDYVLFTSRPINVDFVNFHYVIRRDFLYYMINQYSHVDIPIKNQG